MGGSGKSIPFAQIFKMQECEYLNKIYTKKEQEILDRWEGTEMYYRVWNMMTSNGELLSNPLYKTANSFMAYNLFFIIYGKGKDGFFNILPRSIKKTKDDSVIDESNTDLPPINLDTGKFMGNPVCWDLAKWRKDQLTKPNKAARGVGNILYDLDLKTLKEKSYTVNKKVWKEIYKKVKNSKEFKIASENIDHPYHESTVKFSECYNKGWISLDFFCYEYGINIEHDGSGYHDHFKDVVRDSYLKDYENIHQIYRIVDYTKKQELSVKNRIKNLVSKSKYQKPKPNPNILTVINYTVKQFIIKYDEFLGYLDSMLGAGKTLKEIQKLRPVDKTIIKLCKLLDLEFSKVNFLSDKDFLPKSPKS